ncbi:MAG: transcription-repair coupling factor [Lachnospiraceae bacterium]|nr:transcription-repair coupling factor [Lachnospiraceae bacterium]
MLDALSKPFLALEELERVREAIRLQLQNNDNQTKKGTCNLQITGCIDSGLVHMMKLVSDGFKATNCCKIILTFSEQRAREIYEDMKFFDKASYYYPSKDFIFYSAGFKGKQIVTERMRVLKAIAENEDATIIATLDAFMDKLAPISYLKDASVVIDYDSIIDMDAFSLKLIAMGYEKVEQVEMPGQFAIRGSIIDVFSLIEELPFRIDLWDDTIDSIKSFDPQSQRTVENLELITIYPATEFILSKSMLDAGIDKIKENANEYSASLRADMKTEEAHRITTTINELLDSLEYSVSSVPLDSYVNYFYEKPVSLADYFNTKNTIFLLDEPTRILEHANAIWDEYRESMIARLEKGYLLPREADAIWDCKDVIAKITKFNIVHFTTLEQKLKTFNPTETFHMSMRGVNPYNSSFETLIKDLNHYKSKGFSVVILSASKTRAMRLADDLLNEYGLNAFYSSEPSATCAPGQILVTYGNIHKGFEYPSIKFALIAETDIFGTIKKKKKKTSKYSGQKIASFSDLSVNDYVVHENHGLGIYKGIEKITVDKTVKDYIKIEYRDKGNLYIPVTQLDMIQKYASQDAKKPKLNKLGTTEWNKTKSRVRGAVMDIAADLVKLYATRQSTQGYVFDKDTLWQTEFEEMFPYDETEDQLAAIEETKKDMESRKIMDRLICGDVGFGKTEIAIRAAFKAVQSGKQVVFLVPTTILAQQHYNNFVQRMKDYPVTIELMSRFRTPTQQKRAIEGLKKGFVDIVIGTHRVLSKDISYKDLGLLIIDEEQRFGVAHKEKIKQLRENIDVLTLTATPIPRTLHMSLVGIRDMSVLEEAPVDRIPIQTYVMEHNEEMIREAILRELGRGGQVYYVYNKVNNIDEITNRIAALVPDANVAFAHGQMSERRLEQIMYDFINGDIDVLVSTTIIETGLDISNANTMIIHEADKLGLAQLYQLRGRIGRSNRTSYAFLMYKRDKMLKEIAEKRLQAIREFTDLGSGFKIAMRDLEIRGAGNILGAEQSGHMDAVGYDLYCKMLNEAVLIMKGEKEECEAFETAIDLYMDAYIPPSYIKNELQKLNIYKRIAAIETDSEYDDMLDELNDRFGEPPKAVLNLLNIALLKTNAHKAYILEIKGTAKEFRLNMYQKAPVDINKIPSLIEKYRGDLKFIPDANPYFIYKPRTGIKDNDSCFEQLNSVIENVKSIIFQKEDK